MVGGGAVFEEGGVGDEGTGDFGEVGVEEGFVPGGKLDVDAGGGEQGIAASFDDEVLVFAVESGLELIVGS